MAVEVCTYRLLLRGTPVGTHVLRTEHRGQTSFLEGRLLLQGSLGQSVVTQSARVNRRRGSSLDFHEVTEGRGEKRSFDVVFDRNKGLVRASRGGNDQSTAPYIRPYRDPLGLLLELRGLGALAEPVRIPMLGKDVTVLYLGERTVESATGTVDAHVYRLHPGGSYVYVGTSGEHPIVQMNQRLDGQLLDAHLVKIDEEEALPAREEEEKRPRKGRRRRRRRRRR